MKVIEDLCISVQSSYCCVTLDKSFYLLVFIFLIWKMEDMGLHNLCHEGCRQEVSAE